MSDYNFAFLSIKETEVSSMAMVSIQDYLYKEVLGNFPLVCFIQLENPEELMRRSFTNHLASSQ